MFIGPVGIEASKDNSQQISNIPHICLVISISCED